MLPVKQVVAIQQNTAPCANALLNARIREVEAAEGAKLAAAKGSVVKGTAGGATQTAAGTGMKIKMGEVETAKIAKGLAAKGTVTQGAVAGKTVAGKTVAGKTVAIASQPAAKGMFLATTKTVAGAGVGVSTWGPVLLAALLVASGTGIYFYLKKQGAIGELEEIST
ncbi:MAG: hypothetical protein HQM02_02580 [Magnetococcales bacterium]|nr:hypothetical protein [Magnetococcales bacterium]